VKSIKVFLIASALALIAGAAQAQSTTTPTMTAQTTATTMAQGGELAMDSHAVYNTDSRFAAASALGPALTSSNDTCMGSTSAGVQGMSVGVSIGSTWEDKNCKMLKNAREMWNMGMRGAALKLLCTDPDNRYALESTGVDCGESKQAWEQNGSKVAVRKVPPTPAVAVTPAPAADPKAASIEQKAVAIIEADQRSKAPQVASK
jgi:hypothetical protein